MRIRYGRVASALAVLLSASLAVRAANPDLSAVEWKAELAQNGLAYLEPIYLTISISNTSAAGVDAPSPEPGACVWLGLKQMDSGKEFSFVTEPSGRGELETIRVPSGETRSATIDLHAYFRLRDSFGNFELSVVYGTDSTHPFVSLVKAGVKSFSIKLPFTIHLVSDREQKPIALIHWAPRSEFEIDYDSAACVIATHYEDSPYYRYSYYWLGNLIAHNGGDYPLAMECYNRLLRIYPDFPLTQEVRFRQLKIRQWTNQVKDLTAEMNALLKVTSDLEVRHAIENELAKRPAASRTASEKAGAGLAENMPSAGNAKPKESWKPAKIAVSGTITAERLVQNGFQRDAVIAAYSRQMTIKEFEQALGIPAQSLARAPGSPQYGASYSVLADDWVVTVRPIVEIDKQSGRVRGGAITDENIRATVSLVAASRQ